MRNRVSPLEARNKQKVGEALASWPSVLASVGPGLSERVIYAFSQFDIIGSDRIGSRHFTMSHVAARQEMRDLVILLQLPELAGAKSTSKMYILHEG